MHSFNCTLISDEQNHVRLIGVTKHANIAPVAQIAAKNNDDSQKTNKKDACTHS